MIPEMNKVGKRAALAMASLVVLCACNSTNGPSEEEVRKAEANRQFITQLVMQENERSPRFIDEQTRLDAVNLLGNNKLEYLYTVQGIPKEDSIVDIIEDQMADHLLFTARNDPNMEQFRFFATDLVYTYLDTIGDTLFRIELDGTKYADTTAAQ